MSVARPHRLTAAYVLFGALFALAFALWWIYPWFPPFRIAFEDRWFLLRWDGLPHLAYALQGDALLMVILLFPAVVPPLTTLRRFHGQAMAGVGAVRGGVPRAAIAAFASILLSYVLFFRLAKWYPPIHQIVARVELGAIVFLILPLVAGFCGFVAGLVLWIALGLTFPRLGGERRTLLGRAAVRIAWYAVLTVIAVDSVRFALYYLHPLSTDPPVRAAGGVAQCARYHLRDKDACYVYLAITSGDPSLCDLQSPGSLHGTPQRTLCKVAVWEAGR